MPPPLPDRTEGVISDTAVAERDLFRAALEASEDGIILLDSASATVFVSARQRALAGYPDPMFAGGMPDFAELCRFEAGRGRLGAGEPDRLAQARTDSVTRGEGFIAETLLPSGARQVTRGMALAGGGYMLIQEEIAAAPSQTASAIPANSDLDQLTLLPNRELVSLILNGHLAALKSGQVSAVHCVDLDRFRSINARHGRAIGDAVLRLTARRLKELTRNNDVVARIGADRFIVLQPDVARPSDAARLAARILDAVREPALIGTLSVPLGASFGMALAPRDGLEAKTLLARAEAALKTPRPQAAQPPEASASLAG